MTEAFDRYAVTGHPIGHSKSPFIHRWFAAVTGQGLRYDALACPLDGFEAVVRRFRTGGGLGMNVTLPFKEEAFALAEIRTPRAERAGAVNTLSFRGDGTVYGDNTDGVGLIRDLRVNHSVALAGRRILMVGAGGPPAGSFPPSSKSVRGASWSSTARRIARRRSRSGSPATGCGPAGSVISVGRSSTS